MPNNLPCRYSISSWNQLPQCLSNNSKDLHIRVGEFIDDTGRLSGTRICVEHTLFGILFCCLVDSGGDLVSKDVTDGLTSTSILNELAKFGFLVQFSSAYDDIKLTEPQKSILQSVQHLGFNSIRFMNSVTRTPDRSGSRLLAFRSELHPAWLNISCDASASDILNAVGRGTALDLTSYPECSEGDWSWLHAGVFNIPNLLDPNGKGELR